MVLAEVSLSTEKGTDENSPQELFLKIERYVKGLTHRVVTENGEVYTPEISFVKRTFVYINNTLIKQLCNHKL